MAEDSTPLDRPSLSADRIRRETPENTTTRVQDNQGSRQPASHVPIQQSDERTRARTEVAVQTRTHGGRGRAGRL